MNLADLFNKKIGIWGFGVVGKSIANYFAANKIDFEILDSKVISKVESLNFSSKINFLHQDKDLEKFLAKNDLIVPSPGVDLKLAPNFSDKFLSELDLFFDNFKKPIIAVTGSLGKTTITHLICEILKLKNIRAVAAGNIGIGMCDLILKQDEIDVALIEVSSFQLEYCKRFAPEISVWTNFHDNHLDRHGDRESYFDAKFKILKNQSQAQLSLLPFEIIGNISQRNVKSSLNFLSLNKPEDDKLKLMGPEDKLFFVEDGYLLKLKGDEITFVSSFEFPKITFDENWLAIASTLYLYKIDLSNIDFTNLILPEHRLEKFITYSNVDFYNDSKSTLANSTMAAVNKLCSKPTILFLGGLSKGVDRSNFIGSLKNKVTKIICFGAEAEKLKFWCEKNNIESYSSGNLQNAIDICFGLIKSGDQVLFSPAGSSFDLFANYDQRGSSFKRLVVEKIKKEKSSVIGEKEISL